MRSRIIVRGACIDGGLRGTGDAGRTRRKYVPVGSMAPSMAPTVLPPSPVPLLMVSRARGTRAEIQSQKKKAKSKAVANQCWQLPKARHRACTHRARGDVSRGGGHGRAGPLAPWMAPSSPHGWVYGVSCTAMPSASRRIRLALLEALALGFKMRAGGPQARQRTPHPATMYCWSWSSSRRCASITDFTRSPMEITPSTCAPSTTGRWRMR